MYTSYFYSASSTAANILADVVKLLTGETSKANLSANCDQTNTEITATVAAGWTVYDASAGTNAQCLRAAVNDDATKYKYLVVDTNTAGYILLKVYESWNSTTHTGTYLAYASDSTSYCQRLNVTSGGRLEISATARHCWMYSLQGGSYGSSSGNWPSGILERSRLSPWDTVANGYPPFASVIGVASGYSYECRRVSASGADITASYCATTITNSFGASAGTNPPNLPTTTIPSDSSKTLKHMMVPFGMNYVTDGHLGGDFSSFCDIWQTTHNNGANFDTVLNNSNTYMIWAIGTTVRFAVRKG